MVSGVVVGILKEQQSDHIILAASLRVPLPDGMVLERFAPGSSVMILYSRDDATEMVVQSITRSPRRTYLTFLGLFANQDTRTPRSSAGTSAAP